MSYEPKSYIRRRLEYRKIPEGKIHDFPSGGKKKHFTLTYPGKTHLGRERPGGLGSEKTQKKISELGSSEMSKRWRRLMTSRQKYGFSKTAKREQKGKPPKEVHTFEETTEQKKGDVSMSKYLQKETKKGKKQLPKPKNIKVEASQKEDSSTEITNLLLEHISKPGYEQFQNKMDLGVIDKLPDNTPDLGGMGAPATCMASDSMYFMTGVYPMQDACAQHSRYWTCGKCPYLKPISSHPQAKGVASPGKRFKGEVSEGMPKVPMDEMDVSPRSGGKQPEKR